MWPVMQMNNILFGSMKYIYFFRIVVIYILHKLMVQTLTVGNKGVIQE